MSLMLLISLVLSFKEPPTWHEAVHLHEPLLPGTVTTLTASEDFVSIASRLAESATVHRTSSTHPKIVHQYYRDAILGEHIFIAPDNEPEILELRETVMGVLSIVVGFRRTTDKSTCEFSGLLIVDAQGLIHEYAGIPIKHRAAFQGHFKRWVKRRVQATEAARARVNK